MASRTLDISDPQVLENHAADAGGFFWHHRVLLSRVGPGIWIGWSPDHELARIDLNQAVHEVCDRNSAFPNHIADAGIYCFDPVRPEELVAARHLAKLQASLLGDGPLAETAVPTWRYAEAVGDSKKLLGQTVDPGLVVDDTTFVALGLRGLVQTEAGIVVCEAVMDESLDEWVKSKKAMEVDVRVLPVAVDSNGRRELPLREALPRFRNDEQKDWPHDGPRSLQEFLQSVAEGPGNLVSYHLERIRSSGVRDSTAQAPRAQASV